MGETTTEVREKGAGGRRPLALLCVEESLEVEEAVLWGAPTTTMGRVQRVRGEQEGWRQGGLWMLF